MKKNINNKLKNSWETLDDIIAQYYDTNNVYVNELNKYNEFERNVFLLYCEYNSMRKVAQETNVSIFTIFSIIHKIKGDLITLKITEE